MAESLKAKLTEELRTAMKAGDKCRVSVIRMLMASVKNAEIEKHGDLSDTEVLGQIAKECKKRNESIEAFKLGKREDLVAQEEAELAILKAYLPEQLSREEITESAREAVSQANAATLQDKGKVMAILMPKMKGRADGKIVNEVVNELLQG
ncbi:MAG: GatB/YqeY domain-containing protein [Dehalococcoidaceae bacterium]|nr:GatB/YqeY domain-containing protein [Dehalococcoidaceae bacterium]